jgi:hypothetical protein
MEYFTSKKGWEIIGAKLNAILVADYLIAGDRR